MTPEMPLPKNWSMIAFCPGSLVLCSSLWRTTSEYRR
ncbi:MAG: hypothetical protein QOI25_4422 [Mycobacterium sp.]|nr:hypothetical protein [Mycobacterium sp.]